MVGWRSEDVRGMVILLTASLALTLLGLAGAVDAAAALCTEAGAAVRL